MTIIPNVSVTCGREGNHRPHPPVVNSEPPDVQLGRSRVYPVERIKDMCLESPSVAPDFPGTTTDFYGMSLTIDGLAFECEAKTIWFACGLDEAEARQLLGTIKGHVFSRGRQRGLSTILGRPFSSITSLQNPCVSIVP